MASSRNNQFTEQLQSAFDAFLNKNAKPNSHLVVAFSGGLDSRTLLSLAATYAKAGNARLSAFYVNHGLSPHAKAWEAFCAETCRELAISFSSTQVEVTLADTSGLEAAARKARYACLDQIDADHILLGHHAMDQAETLLLNLLRGAGVRGAAAMQPVSGAAGRYLRPLLGATRDELLSYATEQGLKWIEDESNADVTYSRNYLRHEVFPRLMQRYPATPKNFARAAANFAESQVLLDDLAIQDLMPNLPRFPVRMETLQGLSEARALNVLRYVLAEEGLQAPDAVRLREGLRQFITAGADKHPALVLPGYRLFRHKGMIDLERLQSS